MQAIVASYLLVTPSKGRTREQHLVEDRIPHRRYNPCGRDDLPEQAQSNGPKERGSIMRSVVTANRLSFSGLFTLTASLLALLLSPQFTHEAVAPEAITSSASILYPIELRVLAESPVQPGATVDVRIEVESRLALADVSLRIKPPPMVDLLTPAQMHLGRLTADELRTETLRLRLPQSTQRRTVEVTVSGWTDSYELTRSAILNLLPGGPEPSRLVTRPDGQPVREVRARRAD